MSHRIHGSRVLRLASDGQGTGLALLRGQRRTVTCNDARSWHVISTEVEKSTRKLKRVFVVGICIYLAIPPVPSRRAIRQTLLSFAIYMNSQ